MIGSVFHYFHGTEDAEQMAKLFYTLFFGFFAGILGMVIKQESLLYNTGFLDSYTLSPIKYLEPDISVVCDKNKLNDHGCSGAPDWIIEIVSPSSRPMDYYTKLSLYRSAGVREYWIVDPMKQTILVYDMEHDSAPAIYSFADNIKVNIYDDLWIDFRKLNL